MGFLVSARPTPLSHSSSLYGVSSTWLSVVLPTCRLPLKPIGLPVKSFNGLCFSTPVRSMRRGAMAVNASFGIKGTGPDSDSEEEDVLFDEIPMDSKLQLKLEKKMRMKLGKKMRLRRKKLDRKRRMRRRGQWPPSKAKMKKNV